MSTRNSLPSFACAALLAAHGAALGAAEIGGESRLSDMGPNGPDYAAWFPHVAYNPIDDEYLVVWQGDDNVGGSQNNEIEIFGQRIDAATGQEIGANDFRISDMGGTNLLYGADSPRVVFNPAAHEYLVVWSGDDNVGGLVDGEWEIFGQRLDAAGNPIGADDFRISHAGGTGTTTYQAKRPAVAWSSTANEYLVVWVGDDDSVEVGEIEVFGQRLDAAGNALGDDFRITDLGVEAFNWYIVYSADVVYNPTADEYLVVAEAEDDQGGMVEGEVEIFAQRLDGANGAEVGPNDFRVSDMGGSGTSIYAANWPRVAYNPVDDEYLVVWRGDDNVGGLVNDEFEVFGQRLDGATGAEVGANDFRVSELGGTGNVDFGARHPAVAHDPNADTYFVVWWGFVPGNGLDVCGQYLSATGGQIGANDELLSDGAIGERDAIAPTVAYASGPDQHLVVWYGDQSPALLNEDEIFAQRTTGTAPLFADGFESGDTSMWSSTTP